MSKRSLFVSFAESDGGHSYLAARTMLEPSSIAHLLFKNTVAESLEAVSTGQANYAVVPAYNSITQWEGATLKALASGQFEICAQVCMPTSYVLVAHKDYMAEFLSAYNQITNANTAPSEEDAAKIYTRFLSRIFVGAQADEQYRGRLLRPDMMHATVDLSRNPLRVLEEMTRTEFMKAMSTAPGRAASPYPRQPLPPHVSGGGINLANTPIIVQPGVTAPQPIMETLQAPAALVAAGLLDAPGDPEGWDQPGSLGEIVALLRKLLVLLNVHSFGAPDLPENKTQYLLVGRRGMGGAPAGTLRLPAAQPPTRIMTLVRPSLKRSSADQWLRPRNALARKLRDFGYVLDRAPIMVTTGGTRAFLLEGGAPRSGAAPVAKNISRGFLGWLGSAFRPPAALDKPKSNAPQLRKEIEKKSDRERDLKDDTPAKFDTMFLGTYPSWCHGLNADACWCCEEAHAESRGGDIAAGAPSLIQILVGALIATVAAALIFGTAWCSSGACNVFGPADTYRPPAPQTVPDPQLPPPPRIIAPAPRPTPVIQPKAPKIQEHPSYPGVTEKQPAPRVQAPVAPPRLVDKKPTRTIPKFAPDRPLMLHVAFTEAKSNLTRESFNVLTSAASQAMQGNKTVNIRVFGLGGRESDENLWRRRLYAVKDELVRLGVPFERLRTEGTGPYVVIIKSNEPKRPRSARQRLSYDLDSIDDPLAND